MPICEMCKSAPAVLDIFPLIPGCPIDFGEPRYVPCINCQHVVARTILRKRQETEEVKKQEAVAQLRKARGMRMVERAGKWCLA
jgi:hypothetical protein